jgi:hypothetical protein
MKTTSKTAVAVAAGMLFSLSAASAADLGGNCCSDLEERVAELEATAARKGTRTVSLTISGQVNKVVMYYSDGGPSTAGTPTSFGNRSSNTFWGQDNTNSSSRFNLTGKGKIDGTRNAGYNMTIEVAGGARTATSNQVREEAGAGGTNVGRDDHYLAMRDSNVWIEDTRLGRLTLGRLTPPGPQGTIDLGGIGVIAPGTSLIGNAIFYRNSTTGLLTGVNVGNGVDNGGDSNKRMDGLRYESPTWQGFQFAAAIGEASETQTYLANIAAPAGSAGAQQNDLGRQYAANLRYANEFNGVRVAAAIGYEKIYEDGYLTPAGNGGQWGVSASLMHAASGLFVQGSWAEYERNGTDGTFLHIAGGVSKNWFGIGNTSLYGEYGAGRDIFQALTRSIPAGFNSATAVSTARGDSDFWGLGVVQNVNSANLEVYAGYRNYSADIATQTVTNGVGQGFTATPTKDVSVFATGMRIKF